MSALENTSYDKDLDVYFQKNTWADTEFVIKWAKRTVKLSKILIDFSCSWITLKFISRRSTKKLLKIEMATIG